MNIDIARLIETFPDRRWFGGKTRAIDAGELVDAAVLDDGPPALCLALVEVRYRSGDPELFHLPLLVDEDGTARDATEEPHRLRLLGELMAHASSIKGDHGVFGFEGPGLNPSDPPGYSSVRLMGAEQTNTSVVLDEKVIVKLFRKTEEGTNPDLEISRWLTSEGFEHVPAHVGEITYEMERDGEPVTIDVGIAQRFVTDGYEGWQETLNQLHALYDQVDPADVREDFPFLIEERAADLLSSIAALGDITAAMHIALAREEADPAFAPEEIDEFDLREWAESARASLDSLMETAGEDLHPFADGIEARVDMLTRVEDPGLKSRIHGDYHLGQTLRRGRGWLILDFEGEPARRMADRRVKQSPLRDVAGMLRSFSYAATAALFQRADPDSAEWERLEPWANTWERLARDRFLGAYLKKSHEGRFLPADRHDLMLLLDVFETDKALYELNYERSHRPAWVRIPLRGITQIARRSQP